MHSFVTALAIAIAFTGATSADARPHARHYVVHGYGGSSDYYTAVSGHRVHRPVQASQAPAGASAQCRDRTWSFSENHRGTCSHHGGVARWL
uniref:DUF3761 domain-containing protein n=1 Tax=Sphingomonas bacterium TaxID=1895847 RepID=UPI002617D2DA|nr:DUF3761 domain-containing protein [Sphingomonas bacterium]